MVMPILLDVQQALLVNKSRAENLRDIERCLAAVDKAAAEHNRVIRTHHPNLSTQFDTVPQTHELPGGVLVVAAVIQTGLLTTKSPDDNALDVARCLQRFVHAAAEHNRILLEHWPSIPDLYDSGVRYITDRDAWKWQALKSSHVVRKQGGSDCKNLAAYRLGHKWRDELRPAPLGFGRRMSRCKIYWRMIDPRLVRNMLPADISSALPAEGPIKPGRLFHAETRSPDGPEGYVTADGDVEDMSRYLGM